MTAAQVDDRAVLASWRVLRLIPAVALVSGIVATALPAVLRGGAYAERWVTDTEIVFSGENLALVDTVRLRDIVGHDVAWTVVLASLVVLPLWFWFWRSSAMSAARLIGVVASLGAAASVFVLAQSVTRGNLAFMADGLYLSHVAAGLCFAAAFALAPPPRE